MDPTSAIDNGNANGQMDEGAVGFNFQFSNAKGAGGFNQEEVMRKNYPALTQQTNFYVSAHVDSLQVFMGQETMRSLAGTQLRDAVAVASGQMTGIEGGKVIMGDRGNMMYQPNAAPNTGVPIVPIPETTFGGIQAGGELPLAKKRGRRNLNAVQFTPTNDNDLIDLNEVPEDPPAPVTPQEEDTAAARPKRNLRPRKK